MSSISYRRLGVCLWGLLLPLLLAGRAQAAVTYTKSKSVASCPGNGTPPGALLFDVASGTFGLSCTGVQGSIPLVNLSLSSTTQAPATETLAACPTTFTINVTDGTNSVAIPFVGSFSGTFSANSPPSIKYSFRGGTPIAGGAIPINETVFLGCRVITLDFLVYAAPEQPGGNSGALTLFITCSCPKPTIKCPDPCTVECPATADSTSPAHCGTATATTPGAGPDCKTTVTHSDGALVPGTCPGTGTITRTWTATNDCGETATCTQLITVVDTTPPVIKCAADKTIECPATPSFTAPTCTDTCDPAPSITFVDSSTPGTCPGTGKFTRTWTCTDCSGNHASCSQTITVVDTTPPVIKCAADATIDCTATPSFTAPTATDTCDPNPKVTFVDTTTGPSDCINGFITTTFTRTWTATDCSGNHASCSQTLTQKCPCGEPGRMTGGGSVFTADGRRVTHGFELHCDASITPNNLEINWKGTDGKQHNFHLDTLTSATCTDDPAIAPPPPAAPFDTFTGAGTGKLDGKSGATITFVLTDAGEPGVSDTAVYTITAPDGTTTVLAVPSTNLTFGNQQAHKSNK